MIHGSEGLTRLRCFHHTNREAAARCPECGRFFCRECITEHQDRVLCAACLEKAGKKKSVRKFNIISGVFPVLQLTAGIVLSWLFFYYLGQILLSLPSEFHEGTFWEKGWWL